MNLKTLAVGLGLATAKRTKAAAYKYAKRNLLVNASATGINGACTGVCATTGNSAATAYCGAGTAVTAFGMKLYWNEVQKAKTALKPILERYNAIKNATKLKGM